MSTYAIGDLQGCDSQLRALLHKIDAEGGNRADRASSAAPDRYVFVGDIVNRGPESLQALRRIHALGERAQIVLGNHDLHLLAAALGIRRAARNDTLDAILQAPDRDVLLEWLRRQPLAYLHAGHLIVHAGVLPQWTVGQTLDLAAEVQEVLRGPHWAAFLANMYGNLPAKWNDSLTGHDRLRCIVNALTRVRLCMADGTMILEEASEAARKTAAMPWFEIPGRRSATATVVFGHWSALGLHLRPNLIGLDTGCLWGGKLSAVRLEDRTLFQVDCPQYQAPTLSA